MRKKSQFKYKIEMDDIKLLVNYGRKSYYHENYIHNVLTVTGLRLSTYDIHFLKKTYLNRINFLFQIKINFTMNRITCLVIILKQ